MENKFIYLDLNIVTLLGWEGIKKISKIESMVESIEREEEFPPVYVKKIDNNVYALVVYYDDYNVADGGHYRAIAHYMANKPLKCELVDFGTSNECKIPITNIFLGDDEEHKKLMWKYNSLL